ncbi:MAG: amidase family protein, partial [Planctomycetota bacterium]|nr:amidase family protein [Planctomycetota bacterium]
MSSKQDRRTFVSMLAAMAAIGPGIRMTAEEADVSIGAGLDPASPPDGQGAPPDLDAVTLEQAEKLAGISFTPGEREQILRTIAEQRAMIARRLELGPLPNELPPAEVFRAQLPGVPLERATGTGEPSSDLPDPGPCPDDDLELAYAPVWRLGQWLKRGSITSLRLTKLSIRRLKEADPRLRCVVSLTEERALAQARQADRELRSGRWRGPLHGVPWGA